MHRSMESNKATDLPFLVDQERRRLPAPTPPGGGWRRIRRLLSATFHLPFMSFPFSALTGAETLVPLHANAEAETPLSTSTATDLAVGLSQVHLLAELARRRAQSGDLDSHDSTSDERPTKVGGQARCRAFSHQAPIQYAALTVFADHRAPGHRMSTTPSESEACSAGPTGEIPYAPRSSARECRGRRTYTPSAVTGLHLVHCRLPSLF